MERRGILTKKCRENSLKRMADDRVPGSFDSPSSRDAGLGAAQDDSFSKESIRDACFDLTREGVLYPPNCFFTISLTVLPSTRAPLA